MELLEERHFEFNNTNDNKENLVEAAMATVKRLDNTINNEMKKWNHERTALQSKIHKLETALYNVGKDASITLQSQDPLVKYQSEEIERLKTRNQHLSTQLLDLNDVLLETKQTITTSINEKVKNQMAEINDRIDVERQQLVKEISDLRREIDESETGIKMKQLKMDINGFIEGDRALDDFFSKFVSRVDNIIRGLTNQLAGINQMLQENSEETVDDNDSEGLEYLSCSEEQQVRDVNFEVNSLEKNSPPYLYGSRDEIKISQNVIIENKNKQLLLKKIPSKDKKILKRIKLPEKTKLRIALRENKKLSEKIKTLTMASKEASTVKHNTKLNSVQTDLAIQTDDEVQKLQLLLKVTEEQLKTTNDKLIYLEKNCSENNNKKKDLEDELIIMRERNDDIMKKLTVEETATKEALRQFQRSSKEIEQLKAELEDTKLNCTEIKIKNSKLIREKTNFRSAETAHKKKSRLLGKAGDERREFLENKIQELKSRNQKLTEDIKLVNGKNIQLEKIIKDLEEKTKNSETQIEFLRKESENISENLKKKEEENLQLNRNLIKLRKELEKLHNERENLMGELEIARENVCGVDAEILYVKKLSSDMMEENRKLKKKIEHDSIEIDELTSRVSDSDNKIHELKETNKILNSTISALQSEIEQTKNTINITKVDNEKLTDQLLTSNTEINSLKSRLSELENEKNSKKKCDSLSHLALKEKSKLFKDEINQGIENSRRKKVNEEIERKKNNKLNIANCEKTLKKNLQDAEKQLSGVKSELSKVKDDIDMLKGDLENGKYGMYLEMENRALKEELAKLRTERNKLIEEIQKYRKVKNQKVIKAERNIVNLAEG